jgi:RHS repeat-associated protein
MFRRDPIPLLSGGGTVVARYDYDPYGRSTTVLGTTPTDFNFTGLYRHSKSNLNLAVYRAYDPDLGRWLSRDPIGEEGGINLYGYVGGNPINTVDLLGLYYRAYSADETQRIFLDPAFKAATDPILGLFNIAHNSRAYGPYDFGSLKQYEGDTFCVDGRKYDPNQFANYIAGYQGAAYDNFVGSPVPALALVNLAGMYYHRIGWTKAENDPWDATGRPDIAAGAAGAPSNGVLGVVYHILFTKP